MQTIKIKIFYDIIFASLISLSSIFISYHYREDICQTYDSSFFLYEWLFGAGIIYLCFNLLYVYSIIIKAYCNPQHNYDTTTIVLSIIHMMINFTYSIFGAAMLYGDNPNCINNVLGIFVQIMLITNIVQILLSFIIMYKFNHHHNNNYETLQYEVV